MHDHESVYSDDGGKDGFHSPVATIWQDVKTVKASITTVEIPSIPNCRPTDQTVGCTDVDVCNCECREKNNTASYS